MKRSGGPASSATIVVELISSVTVHSWRTRVGARKTVGAEQCTVPGSVPDMSDEQLEEILVAHKEQVLFEGSNVHITMTAGKGSTC